MSDNPISTARKSIRSGLVIAGMQIGGALCLTLIHRQGMIDQDTVTRGVMVLIGLGIAAFGNAMPKTLDGPQPLSRRDASAQQAIKRVSGWMMLLGGLVYAGLWAFAPRDVALFGCVAAMVVAMLVMALYSVWRFAESRRAAS